MKLIVGSKSPRRKQMLEEMGYAFEIRVKETDESYPEHYSPKEAVCHISEQKAKALQSDLQSDEVLLTADTVVCVENEILGKPKDFDDAVRMLKLLSGKSHQVITAISIATATVLKTDYCETVVYVKPLSEEEIVFYINHYQPFDKAGGYGIQEWFGAVCIERIEGSYNNVVGLPTHLVYLHLTPFLLIN
ncbi:MAG: Maf family protein [Crocinitomicaceae bacterium]|nr:Maf family protein [Crocinitomicaceae bacterium]